MFRVKKTAEQRNPIARPVARPLGDERLAVPLESRDVPVWATSSRRGGDPLAVGPSRCVSKKM